MNDQQAKLSKNIATWFANKKTYDATAISAEALELLNNVGEVRFKKSIMRDIRAIQQGLSHNYSGRNFIAKGIHPVKNRFIQMLYKQLVREHVIPVIYKFVEQSVEPGAFVKAIMLPEHVSEITRPVTEDETIDMEAKFKDLISRLKTQNGAMKTIVDAINENTFNELEFESESSSSSEPESPVVIKNSRKRTIQEILDDDIESDFVEDSD